MTVLIVVPVLNRPHRVKPLLESIEETTPGNYRVLFVTDPYDRPERKALEAAKAEWLICAGGYATKVNYAIEHTDEPLVFAGADDLHFHENWLAHAQLKLDNSRIQVVGVNDLMRRRRQHATHFLLTRSYCERPTIDGEQGPFSARYNAWYCDDELIMTAKKRRVYAYAPKAVVEHLHPMNGKAPDDPVYVKGRRLARRDRKTFQERSKLWT